MDISCCQQASRLTTTFVFSDAVATVEARTNSRRKTRWINPFVDRESLAHTLYRSVGQGNVDVPPGDGDAVPYGGGRQLVAGNLFAVDCRYEY